MKRAFASMILALGLVAPMAHAAPATAASVQAAITAKLTALAESMARGDAADKIVALIYWPDAVAGVEGVPEAMRGYAQLIPEMKAAVPEGKGAKCAFSLVGPVVVSGRLATVYGNTSCQGATPDKPENSHSLYVFQNRGGHWKVLREQIAMGLMK